MDIINSLFVYCTDFIINIANILSLSYYEINLIVFCLLYPLLIIGLTTFNASLRIKLKALKAQD